MSFPGKYYSQWLRDANKQLYKVPYFAKPKLITLTFFPKTKRSSDLSNKMESVMDCLVENGVLLDDNWYEVPHVELIFGGVDKINPRVEIEIN